MIPTPEYDEVHVISDLHMGGEKHQIFYQGELLAALIEKLRALPNNKRVALVINGDMVDFLAEPAARCFDANGAVRKLERIVEDTAFAPVWAALRRFAATAGRDLVITLGNHDLELALPWVRERLLEILTEGNESPRGRIRLVFDGSGFACRVSQKNILCLHGNEVDTWNVTDYEMLRRAGRDAVQDRTLSDWTPNAGSKLVIDVMNEVKQTYAFVDLLKPEVQAVVPVLLALDQAQAPRLQRVLLVASRLGWDSMRRATGFLKSGETRAGTELTSSGLAGNVGTAAEIPANGAFHSASLRWQQAEAAVLLASAERSFRSGVSPLMLAEQAKDEQLGAFAAAWSWVRGADREETLLAALKDLERDVSFELHEPDTTCRRVNELVGKQYDFVITGHTHMEKTVWDRDRWYFNTGSWVPRIRLTPAMLASIHTFRPVLKALEEGQSIEQLRKYEGLIVEQPVVCSIVAEAKGATPYLRRVEQTATGAEFAHLRSW